MPSIVFIPCVPMCLSTLPLWKKADNVYVIPSSFGWMDLSTWNSAYDNFGERLPGQRRVEVKCDHNRFHQVHGSCPNEKLLVLQGLDDLLYVDTKRCIADLPKGKKNSPLKNM